MFFDFSSPFLRVPLPHVTSGELTEQQRLEIISIIMEALLQKEQRSLCKEKNFFLGKLGKLLDGSFLCLAQKGKDTQKWFKSKEQIANILHNKIPRIQEVANSLQEGVVWGSGSIQKRSHWESWEDSTRQKAEGVFRTTAGEKFPMARRPKNLGIVVSNIRVNVVACTILNQRLIVFSFSLTFSKNPSYPKAMCQWSIRL